jgi:hypothetical protein
MINAAELMSEISKLKDYSNEMGICTGEHWMEWRIAADSWNKFRNDWFLLLERIGLNGWREAFCPGQVPLLPWEAAQVVWFKRWFEKCKLANSRIWLELPRPWEVLLQGKSCPRSLVDSVCEKHDAHPVKSRWSGPKTRHRSRSYKPTPELVHGIETSSLELAALLHKAGVINAEETG